ncbi:DNA-binding protein [Defluviimonas sp. WL0002]|uniref:DNA-binding protein n=1 Tax=Albidovulum marisflavi TaxID=2984159 RepID=A0ABT2ZGI8_9RHOB|nr:DNA-binding protein [Defluviimonas sp. WL0002]MCV2870221.1 DNA-binding protein [Defluviimonas sp. WL0002]
MSKLEFESPIKQTSQSQAFEATQAVDPMLSDIEGANVMGFSKSSFRRRVADGTIPPPVKIGGLSRWPLSELLAVIKRAKDARNAA